MPHKRTEKSQERRTKHGRRRAETTKVFNGFERRFTSRREIVAYHSPKIFDDMAGFR